MLSCLDSPCNLFTHVSIRDQKIVSCCDIKFANSTRSYINCSSLDSSNSCRISRNYFLVKTLRLLSSWKASRIYWFTIVSLWWISGQLPTVTTTGSRSKTCWMMDLHPDKRRRDECHLPSDRTFSTFTVTTGTVSESSPLKSHFVLTKSDRTPHLPITSASIAIPRFLHLQIETNM